MNSQLKFKWPNRLYKPFLSAEFCQNEVAMCRRFADIFPARNLPKIFSSTPDSITYRYYFTYSPLWQCTDAQNMNTITQVLDVFSTFWQQHHHQQEKAQKIYNTWIVTKIDNLTTQALQRQLLKQADAANIVAAFHQVELAGYHSVIHGDLSPRNIIYSPVFRNYKIIDFEYARSSGHINFDLARLALSIQLFQPQNYPNLFSEIQQCFGYHPQSFAYFLIYHALNLLLMSGKREQLGAYIRGILQRLEKGVPGDTP